MRTRTGAAACLAALALAAAVPQRAEAQLSLKDDSMMFDYFFMTAMGYCAQEKYPQAVETLVSCLKINPKSATVPYELSRILASAREYEKAAKFANTAVRLDTLGNKDIIRNAISINEKTDNLAANVVLYDRLIGLEPENQELFVSKALLQEDLEDYEGALSTLDRVKTSPDQRMYWNVLREKGDIYIDMGKPKKGLALYQQVVSRPEATAQDHYFHSLALAELTEKGGGGFEKAIEACKKAIAMDEGDYYLEFLAELYIRTQQDDKAEQTFRQYFGSHIVGRDDKMKTLFDYLARGWKQKYAKANQQVFIPSLKVLLEQYPSSAEVCTMVQSFYDSWGLKDAALKTLESFVQDNPGNEYIWRNLVKYLSEKDAPRSRILSYTTRAVQEVPDDWLLSMLHGEYLLMEKRHEEAIAPLRHAYSLALQLDDQQQSVGEVRTSILHNIANCYYYTDSVEKAYQIYDIILQQNPDDALALNNYAYYLAVRGKEMARAEQMSSRSLKIQPTNTSFLDTYAYILYHNNSSKEALFVMERCIEIMKNTGEELSAELLDHYADILYLNGQVDKAVKTWDDSVRKAKTESIPYYGAEKTIRKRDSRKYIQ